jgi:outer membrane lipoprotein-sorting protein
MQPAFAPARLMPVIACAAALRRKNNRKTGGTIESSVCRAPKNATLVIPKQIPRSPRRPRDDSRALFRRVLRFPIVLLLIVAWLVFLPLARAAQDSWTLDAVLKQLDREAGQFQSLTADVERTKVTVVVNDRSTESGQIQVRRDNKMRIDLTSPDPKMILRDGDHLYIYTPKIRRVEEYDLGKHRALVEQFLLLGFGTSGDSLKKSYSIRLLGEETLERQKVVRLELIPKSEEVRRQISKIDLWVNEANWLAAQQQFYETGSRDYFVIHYANVARNVRLADSRFRPAWPKSVTRVKPQS